LPRQLLPVHCVSNMRQQHQEKRKQKTVKQQQQRVAAIRYAPLSAVNAVTDQVIRDHARAIELLKTH